MFSVFPEGLQGTHATEVNDAVLHKYEGGKGVLLLTDNQSWTSVWRNLCQTALTMGCWWVSSQTVRFKRLFHDIFY